VSEEDEASDIYDDGIAGEVWATSINVMANPWTWLTTPSLVDRACSHKSALHRMAAFACVRRDSFL